MAERIIYRIICGVLFITTLVTRKVYETRSEAIAKNGLVCDYHDKRLIGTQRALLTFCLLALIVYLVNPGWMRWSTIEIAA